MGKKGCLIVVGVAVLVVIGALVIVLGGVCVTQVGPAEAVLDEFMVAGQAHDIDGAYALCSPGGISRSELEEFIEDDHAAFFENYEGIHTTSWEVQTSGGLTTAILEGNISYTDGSTLPYYAELAKIGGEWKISYMYIGY